MPFSRTLPRGLRRAAPGAIASPRGSRSCSSPPVPCSNRRGGWSVPSGRAGTKRCSKPRLTSGMDHSQFRLVRGEVRKCGLNSFTVGLEPRRECEPRAQFSRCLVSGETRTVRRDLQQYSARLAEVDGPKVLPILYRRHLNTGINEPMTKVGLGSLVGSSECDVMNRPGSTGTPPEAANLAQVHDPTDRCITHESHPTVFLSVNPQP